MTSLTKAISTGANLLLFRLGRRLLGSSCLRRAMGCAGLVALVGTLLCGMLTLAVGRAGATVPERGERSIFLIVDQSNSMFERSDPDLLRAEAMRLFISYLGVDDAQAVHEVGVIAFGGEARLVAPLTALSDDVRRAELVALATNPQRMSWTDPAEALELALEHFQNGALRGRPAIVLLTDGEPAWNNYPTDAERTEYIIRLQTVGQRLAEAHVPVFVIFLANQATDAEPQIAQVWQPLWEAMAAAVPPGGFYVARAATDLTGIYHDVVVALTGGSTDGPVLDASVVGSGLRKTVTVEPGLERMTLVVSKSEPSLRVIILRPEGRPLLPEQAGVRHAGEPGVTSEEIWAVDTPTPGDWTVLLGGTGRVVVWKDYQLLLHTPTATATPTPTATLTLTATRRPTATLTPEAILLVEPLPAVALTGQTLIIVARITHPPGGLFDLRLQVTHSDGEVQTKPLLDDGRQGDVAAGDGAHSAVYVPERPGEYVLSVIAVRQGRQFVRWQTRLQVQARPTLVLVEPASGARLWAGHALRIRARWEIGGQPLAATAGIQTTSGHAFVTVGGTQPAQAVALSAQVDGSLVGQYVPQSAETVSVAVRARAVLPSKLEVEARSGPVAVQVRMPVSVWVWSGLFASAVSGSGWWIWRRRRNRGPLVAGELRVLSAPAGHTGERLVSLDTFGLPQLSVGAAPADLALPNAPDRLVFSAGSRGGIRVCAGAAAQLNGIPLDSKLERALQDGDVLALGHYRLRYENLRLRIAQDEQSFSGIQNS